MMNFLISAMLLLSPAPSGITSVVQQAAAAGCNEFTDDFSGTLGSWTVHANYSLDTTNDELDFTSASTGTYAAMHTTATTDGDHFAKVTAVDGDSAYGVGVILRATDASVGTGEFVYYVAEYDGTIYGGKYQGTATANSLNWTCDLDTSGHYTYAVTDGDVIAASVSGTGASTVISLWINPDAGNCPSDWGTADHTWSNCTQDGCCVDSGSYVGIYSGPNGIQSFTFDNFVGGDN